MTSAVAEENLWPAGGGGRHLLAMLRRAMRPDHLAVFLIMIGAASLIYYKSVTNRGVLTAASIRYRSDFVFVAAVAVGLIDLILASRVRRRLELSDMERVVAVSLGLYLFACLIATLNAYLVYSMPFGPKGLATLGKTVVSGFLLLLTLRALRTRPIVFRWLVAALSIPPLVPAALGVMLLAWPVAYLHLFGNLSLFGPKDLLRFQGLTSNPSQVAMSGVVAIAFLCVVGVYQYVKGRWATCVAILCAVTALAVTVWWSLSRIGVLSMVLVTSLITLAGLPAVAKARRVWALALPAAAVVAMLASWSVLPSAVQADFGVRLMPAGGTAGTNPPQTAAGGLPQPAAGDQRTRISVDRIKIWEYFGRLALKNPLGLGFNYEQRFEFPNPYQSDINAQNNFLAAWLYGGALAVLAVLLFLWICLRVILHQHRQARGDLSSWLYAGAVGAFGALWFSSFVTGILLPDYTHAILAAMVLAGIPRPRDTVEPSEESRP